MNSPKTFGRCLSLSLQRTSRDHLAFTVAEVLVGPAKVDRLNEAQAAVRLLGVTEIEQSSDAAPRLAMLRAETGLKLPDCCVLMAAQDTNANGIITFDELLASVAGGLGLASS